MYDEYNEKYCIIFLRSFSMNILESIMNKLLIFEKEPQRIGLSQFKVSESIVDSNKKEPSLKNKDVKLSDLMRRAS